jgi:hypothetical protein
MALDCFASLAMTDAGFLPNGISNRFVAGSPAVATTSMDQDSS